MAMQPPEISDYINDHEKKIRAPPTFFWDTIVLLSDERWNKTDMITKTAKLGYTLKDVSYEFF